MADIISSPLVSLHSSPALRPVGDSASGSSVLVDNHLYSTPVRNIQQTAADCSASPPLLVHELRLALDQEMRQCFIGPLAINTFFNDFLPIHDDLSPSPSQGFTHMARAANEKQMYESFVRTVNSLFTQFIAFNTSNNPSSEANAEYKPDVCIYEKKQGMPTRPFTSFQTMEMFVEFKHGASADPFVTEDRFFPKLFNNTCDVRGQIVLYATLQQAYQFRTSIFSIGIFGKIARLFRWDRTGCQVTAPIEYSTDEGNCQLTEFFLRLDQMVDDPEGRGWDGTVKDATGKESSDFAAVISAEYERMTKPERRRTRGQIKAANRITMDPLSLNLVESIGDASRYMRRIVTVPYGKKKRDYIVGRPTLIPKSPTGRATRGFVAVAVRTKRIVFLKDNWRPDVGGIKPEDHWYRLLQQTRKHSEGLKKIGSYSHGSDLYATGKSARCSDNLQRTTTHLYARDHGRDDAMIGYIHHRVVQSELYLPLDTCRNSRHFVHVMWDILLAVEHMHNLGIFHRDISIWNIMIDIYGNGRLIDLDMARLKDNTGARQNFRTGTWQFISTAQLLDPGRAYEVSDELESLFFVILYQGLHWFIHNKPVSLSIGHIFDDVRVLRDGRQTGGAGKRHMYTTPDTILQDLEFNSLPFTDFVRGLFRLFQSLALSHIANSVGGKPELKHVKNAKKLNDCRTIAKLMQVISKRKDWPGGDDKVTDDNYPRKEEIDKQDHIGRANLKVTTATVEAPIPSATASMSASTSRVSKRRRGADDRGHETPRKRSKSF